MTFEPISSPFVSLQIQAGQDQLVLDLPQKHSVKQLKEHLGELLKIPPMCQKLVCGITTLRDQMLLEELYLHSDVFHLKTDSEVVSIKLVCTLAEVNYILQNPAASSAQKLTVLDILSNLRNTDADNVISTLLPLLADGDIDVRQFAVDMLGRVGRGCQRVIDAAHDQLEVPDDVARAAAGDLLRLIVQPGDACVLVRLHDQLQHHDQRVQCSVMDVLSQVAERGNCDAISAVSARLEYGDKCVRRTAVTALGRLCDEQGTQSIEAIARLLSDTDTLVRQAAVSALCELDNKACVVRLARTRLTDPSGECRRAALDTLSACTDACWTDADLLDSVMALLEDKCACVREGAVLTLSKLCDRGDRNALTGAFTRLEAHDERVRHAAVNAIAAVGAKQTSHGQAVAQVGAAFHLEHHHQCTRIKATHAVQEILADPSAVWLRSVTSSPRGNLVDYVKTRRVQQASLSRLDL